MFSFRFACDMFIVGADPGVWKTENDEIIREYRQRFRGKEYG